jgi:hypothetical protein
MGAPHPAGSASNKLKVVVSCKSKDESPGHGLGLLKSGVHHYTLDTIDDLGDTPG